MESIFGLWFALKSKLMFLDQTVPFVYHSFPSVVKNLSMCINIPCLVFC